MAYPLYFPPQKLNCTYSVHFLRTAVQPQIAEHRKMLGDIATGLTAHHVVPLATLVQQFKAGLAESGWLTSGEYLKAWKAYHYQHAALVYLKRDAHDMADRKNSKYADQTAGEVVGKKFVVNNVAYTVYSLSSSWVRKQ